MSKTSKKLIGILLITTLLLGMSAAVFAESGNSDADKRENVESLPGDVYESSEQLAAAGLPVEDTANMPTDHVHTQDCLVAAVAAADIDGEIADTEAAPSVPTAVELRRGINCDCGGSIDVTTTVTAWKRAGTTSCPHGNIYHAAFLYTRTRVTEYQCGGPCRRGWDSVTEEEKIDCITQP